MRLCNCSCFIAIGVVTAVAVVIVGNHGPMTPLGAYFPDGGMLPWPHEHAYANAGVRAAALKETGMFPEPVIRGSVVPGYEAVREAMEVNFAAGFEVGAAAVAYVNGERVVDLYGGYTSVPSPSDASEGVNHTLFSADVLATVFSSGKVIESLVVAMLVDRGLLSYSDPICKHWESFCTSAPDEDGRRAAVTVAHLMRHQAGLAAPRAPLTWSKLSNPAVLARQPMEWHPRDNRQGYHAITRGQYVQQLVKRVDPQHRSVGQFIKDEIAGPLGVEIYVGVPPSERRRLTDMHSWPASYMLTNAVPHIILPRAVSRLVFGDAALTTWPGAMHERDIATLRAVVFARSSLAARALLCMKDAPSSAAGLATFTLFHKREYPSANMVTTADAMARVGSVLAAGGSSHGVNLLSPESLAAALQPGEKLLDEVLARDVVYTAAGWGADRFGDGVYGWAGMGGSMNVWVPALNLSLAYVPNLAASRLSKPRGERLLRALIGSVQQLSDRNQEVPTSTHAHAHDDDTAVHATPADREEL